MSSTSIGSTNSAPYSHMSPNNAKTSKFPRLSALLRRNQTQEVTIKIDPSYPLGAVSSTAISFEVSYPRATGGTCSFERLCQTAEKMNTTIDTLVFKLPKHVTKVTIQVEPEHSHWTQFKIYDVDLNPKNSTHEFLLNYSDHGLNPANYNLSSNKQVLSARQFSILENKTLSNTSSRSSRKSPMLTAV